MRETSSIISVKDRWDHFLARWGYGRLKHKVEPDLYRLGSPDNMSPVFVTANYSLSFDSLRESLSGIDCYILVLDTKGINVWCAAGKGTFGTNELVSKIEKTGLKNFVNHRNLILPQLGASGVSGFEVKKRSGFNVKFGPVRSKDIPEYLKIRKATPEMRRVTFNFLDRAVLIPIELVNIIIPVLVAAVLLYFISGPSASVAVVSAAVSGTVLFPLLLPYLPAREFSVKGFILGFITAFPFIYYQIAGVTGHLFTGRVLYTCAYLLGVPAFVAFLALNFTGATPITSKTAVTKEIKRYIPVIAVMTATGIILMIISGLFFPVHD